MYVEDVFNIYILLTHGLMVENLCLLYMQYFLD